MLKLKVAGMTCAHCVAAVYSAITPIPGAGKVTVDLALGQVMVEGNPDPTAVRDAIAKEGYDVRGQAA